MAAFTRELPDSGWYTCRIPGIAAALRNMDEKTTLAANGAAGSTHAPAAKIFVDGAGMVCAGLWLMAGDFVRESSPAALRHGAGHANDYVRLLVGHPGASRSLATSMQPIVSEIYLGEYTTSDNNLSVNARYPGVRAMFPIVPHDRSTITSLRLRFKVTSAHANLPALPRFRLVRVDEAGNVEPLHTPRSGAYRDDGFLDLPTNATTASNYVAGNAFQWSNLYETDRLNVVDLSRYAYFVDFIEESGPQAFTPNVNLTTGAGTQLVRGDMSCTLITSLAPQ